MTVFELSMVFTRAQHRLNHHDDRPLKCSSNFTLILLKQDKIPNPNQITKGNLAWLTHHTHPPHVLAIRATIATCSSLVSKARLLLLRCQRPQRYIPGNPVKERFLWLIGKSKLHPHQANRAVLKVHYDDYLCTLGIPWWSVFFKKFD